MTSVITQTTPQQYIIGSLTAAGFSQRDGWFYPAGDPDRAVIRICIENDRYEIWRRRKLRTPWIKIVSASVREYREAAFNCWRQSWPLTN